MRPERVEELLFRDQPACVVEQVQQQIEQLRREVERRVVPENAIPGAIDDEGAYTVHRQGIRD